jgi:hypothetical protein
VGLLFTLVCTAMTVASIAMPRWVSYRPVSWLFSTAVLHC